MRHLLLFLGHGRALEAYLAGLKLIFALILFPSWPIEIQALSDLQWFVPDILIAAPFATIGSLQAIGLWLNYKGYGQSWAIRAAAALMAIAMWSWMLTKSLLVGAIVTSLFPLAIMSLPASIFILWKAVNRLPVPGAAGLA